MPSKPPSKPSKPPSKKKSGGRVTPKGTVPPSRHRGPATDHPDTADTDADEHSTALHPPRETGPSSRKPAGGPAKWQRPGAR